MEVGCCEDFGAFCFEAEEVLEDAAGKTGAVWGLLLSEKGSVMQRMWVLTARVSALAELVDDDETSACGERHC